MLRTGLILSLGYFCFVVRAQEVCHQRAPNYGCVNSKKGLNITLHTDKQLNCATYDRDVLYPRWDFEKLPKVVQFRHAEANKNYTLVMFNALKNTSILEWIVSNIDGRSFAAGDISRGITRVPYSLACQIPDATQRHIFFAYRETGRAQRIQVPESRYKFNLEYFLSKQVANLCGPVSSVEGIVEALV